MRKYLILSTTFLLAFALTRVVQLGPSIAYAAPGDVIRAVLWDSATQLQVGTSTKPLAVTGSGTSGSPPAGVTSTETPNVTTTGTLNAVCASPTTGCTTAQAITVNIAGRNSVIVQLNSSALNATVTPYLSMDGANWKATSLRNNADGILTQPAGSIALNETAIRWIEILIPHGAMTQAMLAITTYTSGSTAATAVSSNTNPGLLESLSWNKGTQANALAIAVQQFKDAGRTFVALSADGVTPAIADTVITFSKNINGTVTGAQTTYTITSGKTLRIQSINCSFTAGATANIVRPRLRYNTGGACVAGSGLLLSLCELAPQDGTVAANEGAIVCPSTIPDGLEIAGDGTKAICLSESAVAASGTLTCNLIAYEY